MSNIKSIKCQNTIGQSNVNIRNESNQNTNDTIMHKISNNTKYVSRIIQLNHVNENSNECRRINVRNRLNRYNQITS